MLAQTRKKATKIKFWNTLKNLLDNADNYVTLRE
jgi:hypothetical protein